MVNGYEPLFPQKAKSCIMDILQAPKYASSSALITTFNMFLVDGKD